MEAEKQKRLIELLTIGLVVGLLGLLAVMAVRNARASLRDAVRLSDVRQTQLSLELFFNDLNVYPSTEDYIPLGTVSTSCLSQSGFTANCNGSQESVYAPFIAGTPTQRLRRQSSCGGVANAYCYLSDGTDYRIQFELERPNRPLGVIRGANCLTPSGFEAGSCEELP